MPEPRVNMKAVVVIAACLLAALSASAKGNKSASRAPAVQKPAPSYDAARNPAKDLQDAVAEATRTKKRILLEVGGDWCVYCNIMDEAFESHPQLRKVRDAHYVTVMINYSKENPNDAFLAHYPRIADYPHFFVLDSNGTLLQSQPTHKFEHGKAYNVGKIEDFLKKWAQPPRHWLNSVG
ncbi:MAG: thioredoxin family protein [Acidobacteriota bacterium]|nr:thioredoxin family protein [Acidobacteriota bacterium]